MAILNTSNPVELSRALVLAYRPQAFFRRMCSTITHRTKSFLIDIEKKTRFLAPYVRDEEDGKVIARDGYETITFTPPKVGASRNITAKDLEIRLPGQSIVDISAATANSEAVMSGLVIEDMLDLQRSIERREEQQIVEILSTGKVNTGLATQSMRRFRPKTSLRLLLATSSTHRTATRSSGCVTSLERKSLCLVVLPFAAPFSAATLGTLTSRIRPCRHISITAASISVLLRRVKTRTSRA